MSSKIFALRNARSGATIASVRRAADPWTRGVGLLRRKRVAADEGLWIGGCGAVHTLGMRATIDLFFLDGDDRVLKIACHVPPNRLAVSCRHAVTVVELGADPNVERDVVVGDRLLLE
ncbi:MAG: DUF192 domain-containing protein [Candidatus Eremiobacteraeota bacterium]|nr:DUF192 domain-containing protein [Candidatus Eremiobacteraeota bacterium]